VEGRNLFASQDSYRYRKQAGRRVHTFPCSPIFNAEYFAGLTAERREKRMRFGQPYTVYVCPPVREMSRWIPWSAARCSPFGPGRPTQLVRVSVYAPKETTMTPRGLGLLPTPVHHGKKITGRSLDPAPRRLMHDVITQELILADLAGTPSLRLQTGGIQGEGFFRAKTFVGLPTSMTFNV